MKKRRVLVVDDDRPVCEALKKLLETEKFEVWTAPDEATAIEQFQTHAVDLAILDINLGEDNGWDLLRKIRQMDPVVPVVMITAEYGQFQPENAAGADVLIEKPIDVPSFLTAINSLLKEKRSPTEENRCKYVPRTCTTFLTLLEHRCSQPIALSPGIRAALPAWQYDRRDNAARKRLMVIGDPTAMGKNKPSLAGTQPRAGRAAQAKPPGSRESGGH